MSPKSTLKKALKFFSGGPDVKDSGESERGQDGRRNDVSALSSTPPSAKVGPRCLEQTTPLTAGPAVPVQTPATSTAIPMDGESDTAQSLWDRAYAALRTENLKLVEEYERLLSRELPRRNSDSSRPKNNPSDQDESLDETENRMDNLDPSERQAHLSTIIKSALQRMDENKTRYHIFGREFVVQDQIAQGALLVQGMKTVIDEAVKASPEASLAWAGVCVILPLLTNPSVAEQTNSNGFAYVTSRMRFYVALEPLLLPKDKDRNATIPKDLKDEFESHIVDLYQRILEFQFTSVVRFYRKWLTKLGKDVFRVEDWEGMLSRVKELEKIVDDDFTKINDSASRKELEEANEKAERSLEAMQGLLSVAGQQLQVTQEMRDILLKILDEIRDGNQARTQPSRREPVNNSNRDSDTFAQAYGGLGGHVSGTGAGFQLKGGDGGAALVSWKGMQDHRSINAEGGGGGDAKLDSHGAFAGEGKGGNVSAEAGIVPAPGK